MKRFFAKYKRELGTTLCVLLVGSASFALGRISVLYHQEPLHIADGAPIEQRIQESLARLQEGSAPSVSSSPADTATPPKGAFVASSGGTKYYPIDCKTAQRISEENRVYFQTAEDAEAAGYSLTTACKN